MEIDLRYRKSKKVNKHRLECYMGVVPLLRRKKAYKSNIKIEK